MAKKSARSKGYRKQASKKPYLSGREIAVLCAAVVALAVGAFFLFRYDDGALKVQNGEVVLGGENWLVVNGSNTRGGTRYYKLGEAGELEGYNRTTQSLVTDANIPEYLYSPAEEGNLVGSITVTTSHTPAEALAKYARTAVEGVEGTDMGALETLSLAGGAATYYIYAAEREQADVTNAAPAATADAAEGDEAENDHILQKGGATAASPDDDAPLEANRFAKSLAGYIDAPHDSCIVIHVNSSADSAENSLSDEALVDILRDVCAAVTLEAAK